MEIESPFHEGELLVQQRAGEAERASKTGRAISDTIIPGAIDFIGQQPMAVIGSIDPQQNVWASVLFGEPGFMQAAERQVDFDLTKSFRNPSDPFWSNIETDPRVGTLVIELATRRRIRMNGKVALQDPHQMHFEVEEAYPNCPKFIQARQVSNIQPGADATVTTRSGTVLESAQQAFIAQADTFFVASAHPTRGADASHRGGNPGFVQVLDSGRMRIPDFLGNSMFNTLGNFSTNPHAGLVFLDFEGNRMLQLVGLAEVLWDMEVSPHETGGTRRWWDFTIDRWLESEGSLPIQWEFLDYSPHNPKRA